MSILNAMVQLAPRAVARADDDPALVELRALAEFPDVGDHAYVVGLDPQGALTARPIEVDARSRLGFPFRRPSGPRSPQVGPVIKRSVNPKTGVAPNATTLAATLAHFDVVARGGSPAAAVYQRALDALGPKELASRTATLFDVLLAIPEKKTVYVSLGAPPGHDPAYATHLLSVIRGELYGIDDDAPEGRCPLCDRVARLGANALKGAKLNLLNRDNHGVFPDLDVDRAGDRYAVCAACADAIASCYIQRKAELRVVIAGAPALVLPHRVSTGAAPETEFAVGDVLAKARAGRGTDAAEDDLLAALAEESALVSFHVLWATAGDSLDDVTGLITDVPCTRLGVLSARNKVANAWVGSVLPVHRARPFDLRLSLVAELLTHPGGKRTERRNQGSVLAALRRQIARAVYLGERLDERPYLRAVREMLADHLVDPSVDERFVARALTAESAPTKKGDVILRAASWVRHVALLFHYLRDLEVFAPMSSEPRYEPRAERLQKLLAPPSGVDSDPKLFAFLVGVLFGRLLTVQGAQGRNVRSNALTWLRRATLTGDDLPGLYVRVREKFAEYGSEGSAAVREVVHDASALGARLGSRIALDVDTTMYFLFLGQALSGDVFAKEDDGKTVKEKS